VAEGNPAQTLQIDNPRHGRGHGRKQRALTTVEQERLVRVDQELVKGQADARDAGNEGGKAINAIGDFIDFGFHREYPVLLTAAPRRSAEEV
jgi:hypothetical protein